MKSPVERAGAGALEPYHRLIVLQKQIIELVEQNAETERQCALLREQLAREADTILWSRRAARFRWRVAAFALLRRIFGRADRSGEAEERISRRWSKREPDGWACALPNPQGAQE